MKMRLHEILAFLEDALGVLFFIVMFGAISVQVFFRYVLGHPLVWPFELSIYCFVFVTYVGAAIAARRDTHVAFDVIHSRFPRNIRLATGIAANVFIIAVLVSLLPASLSYMKFVAGVKSSALGIPWTWLLASFPAGMGLVVLHLAARTIMQARELIKGERG